MSSNFWSHTLLAVFLISPVFGQQAQDAENNEIEQIKQQLNALREEQLKMRQDLEQIKAVLLRQMQAAQGDPYEGKTVSADEDPFKGSPTAKLTVVEFSDYQ